MDEAASRYRGERVAVCGTVLRGIDARDDADRCVVCLDLDAGLDA